jgi:hypothetical protein
MVLHHAGQKTASAILFWLCCCFGIVFFVLDRIIRSHLRAKREPAEDTTIDTLLRVGMAIVILNLAYVAIDDPEFFVFQSRSGGLFEKSRKTARARPTDAQDKEKDKEDRRADVEQKLKGIRDPKGTQDEVGKSIPVFVRTLEKDRATVLSTRNCDLNSEYNQRVDANARIPPSRLFTTDSSIGNITPSDYLILLSAAIKAKRSERLTDVEIDMAAEILAKMADK